MDSDWPYLVHISLPGVIPRAMELGTAVNTHQDHMDKGRKSYLKEGKGCPLWSSTHPTENSFSDIDLNLFPLFKHHQLSPLPIAEYWWKTFILTQNTLKDTNSAKHPSFCRAHYLGMLSASNRVTFCISRYPEEHSCCLWCSCSKVSRPPNILAVPMAFHSWLQHGCQGVSHQDLI